MKRFITLDTNKKIIGIRNATSIVEGEIESEIGEEGQIMLEDESFIDDTTPIIQQPNEPTNSVIAQMISDLQVDLIIAGVI